MLKSFAIGFVFCAGIGPAAQSAEPVPDFYATDPSCACVANGKRWAQGERACIGGLNMICAMNQNVSTWQSLDSTCQVSSLFRASRNFTPM